MIVETANAHVISRYTMNGSFELTNHFESPPMLSDLDLLELFT
jgi:hypothetical protein